MRKKTDDRFWGIAAVAGAFGIIGAGMLNVMYDYGFASTVGFYLLIASVVAGALAWGWSEPPARPIGPGNAPKPGDRKLSAGAAPTAAASASVDLHTPTPHAESDHVAEEVPQYEGPGTRPAAMDGPREGKPDDLQQIKGVGPALEKLCHSLGFYHYDQIAAWTADEVAWVDQNLEGFKGRVTRDKWVEQAKGLVSA